MVTKNPKDGPYHCNVAENYLRNNPDCDKLPMPHYLNRNVLSLKEEFYDMDAGQDVKVVTSATMPLC